MTSETSAAAIWGWVWKEMVSGTPQPPPRGGADSTLGAPGGPLRHWQRRARRPPGSWPAGPAPRSMAAPRLPTRAPAGGSRCHPRSKRLLQLPGSGPPRSRVAAAAAHPPLAPAPRTSAPSAPHCGAHPAAAAPCIPPTCGVRRSAALPGRNGTVPSARAAGTTVPKGHDRRPDPGAVPPWRRLSGPEGEPFRGCSSQWSSEFDVPSTR